MYKRLENNIAYVPVDYSVVSTIHAFIFTVCSSTVQCNICEPIRWHGQELKLSMCQVSIWEALLSAHCTMQGITQKEFSRLFKHLRTFDKYESHSQETLFILTVRFLELHTWIIFCNLSRLTGVVPSNPGCNSCHHLFPCWWVNPRGTTF